MTDVKQELPDIVGKALVYATLAPHEEPVDPPDHAIVLAVLGLKQERDAAIKRAEEAEANGAPMCCTNECGLPGTHVEVDGSAFHCHLHAQLDNGDIPIGDIIDGWVAARAETEKLKESLDAANAICRARLEENEKLRTRIIEVDDDVARRLRAENEKLRGELGEAWESQHQWETKARRLQASAEKTAREMASLAERQREACAQQFAGRTEPWNDALMGWIRGTPLVLWQEPLVTDAPSKPDSVDAKFAAVEAEYRNALSKPEVLCKRCKGARKIYGEFGESPNIVGIPCPDCSDESAKETPSEPDPAPPQSESHAEPRLRPCDSPNCGGHHE